jgi:GNAT superfamily N-acetyltransferase
MLTATSSLARRIEQAEAGLVAGMGESAARRLGNDQVVLSALGGGWAVMAGAGSPFSKVAGLGFEPLDESALEAIERAFGRFGCAVRIELSSLADPAIGKALSARGYLLTGFENVLGLSLRSPHAPPPPVRAGLVTIERATPATFDEWIEVLANGFMHVDSFDGPSTLEPVDRAVLEPIFRDTAAVSSYAQYIARRGGHLAGGATMRIAEGVAQLCGAATLPEHRRLGIQTALLRERLAHAVRAGCDVAVVTTEPGSKSQVNVQREGFELLYVRAVLIKEP